MNRHLYLFVFVLIFLVIFYGGKRFEAKNIPTGPSSTTGVDALSGRSLSFVENQGQWDKRACFGTKIRGGTVFFCQHKVVFSFKVKKNHPGKKTDGRDKNVECEEYQSEIVRKRFLETEGDVRLKGINKKQARFHYLNGRQPEQWSVDVPSFKKVIYENMYPGIDCIFSGERGALKSAYVVYPSGRAKDIVFMLDGVKKLSVDDSGRLVAKTAFGTLKENKPSCFQFIEGKKRTVSASYSLNKDNRISFRMGKYDKEKTLFIDPGLEYSTYLGGSQWDRAYSVTVDSAGYAYLVGYTQSSKFPATSGAYDTTLSGSQDLFVAKFDPTGSSLIFCTYLGGSQWEYRGNIAVDSSFNIYITGETDSSDFPTTSGAYSNLFFGGGDIVVVKLNPLGNGLIYSTFIGGWHEDRPYGLALDTSGSVPKVYITGTTWSPDLPATPGAFKTYKSGPSEAFVLKLKLSGTGISDLIYLTYLGGAGDEEGYAIAVDNNECAYVTGWSDSIGFPTVPGSFDTTYNYPCTYVTKINPTGTGLVYSTWLGGSLGGTGRAIALRVSGNKAYAYVTGETASSDFPVTTGAMDQTFNGGTHDAYITRLSLDGDYLVYSSYLGGNGDDRAYGVALDSEHHIWVAGQTDSTDFPVKADDYDTTFNGVKDVFLTKIASDGSMYLHSTYIGGSDNDQVTAIAIDTDNEAYLTGYTISPDYPTYHPFQANCAGEWDVFLTKYVGEMIYPPLNFHGDQVENRSLLQKQTINVLNWDANPNNEKITHYRIYSKAVLLAWTLLAEVDSSTFSFLDKNVTAGTAKKYKLVAVSTTGKEGLAAYLIIS
ncbi:MAG: SBBP repeat-containing protein [Candidatus Aminicenantes bacterium]|nr:SBBP repeat-containing protein [Candidatus Aminicenantes bacterium]